MLISIIVPMYNNEKYIKKCLNTLINQTYKNIEIIVVDDGSKDDSIKIVKKIKDNRVILIKQKNSGANIARHNGIKNAKGEYCLFIDSDDWIELDTVEILVNKLKTKKYDIIKFNGITEPDKKLKNNYIFSKNEEQKEMSKNELFDILINEKILNNMCFSMYNTAYLKDLKSANEKLSNCEDFLTNLEIYTKVNDVLFISDILYHYRLNNNSTTRKVDLQKIKNNIDDLMYVHNKLFDYAIKWNISNDKINKMIAYNIIFILRSSLFNIFKINGLRKEEYNKFTSNIFSKEEFNNIYNYLSINDLKTIIKSKSLKYRIKYHFNLCNIYKKNYKLLWINNYYYKILNFIKR